MRTAVYGWKLKHVLSNPQIKPEQHNLASTCHQYEVMVNNKKVSVVFTNSTIDTSAIDSIQKLTESEFDAAVVAKPSMTFSTTETLTQSEEQALMEKMTATLMDIEQRRKTVFLSY
ncbi:hypothetical protein NLY09_09115 (plasmid) [Burkholderia vietnamiensis]